MQEENQVATAPADAQDNQQTDRIEVETNIEATPEKGEAEKKDNKPAAEPKEAPPAEKTVNPRTQQRKAEKERLIRENAELKERTRAMEERINANKPKEEAKGYTDFSKEPDISQYEDVMLYTRDLAKYEANQLLSQRDEKQKVENQAKQFQTFQEQLGELNQSDPEVVTRIQALDASGLLNDKVGTAIGNAALSSSMSAKLFNHLAQHGQDLMILRGLPEGKLPMAIKQIEQFIQQGGRQEVAEEKPRVTRATAPITPPGNTARTDRSINSFTQEEIENMPISEFKKLTNMKN